MDRAVGRRWLAVLAALPVMVCESPWKRASERRRLEGRNGTAGGAHPAANAMRGFRTRDMQELNINPGDRPASGARTLVVLLGSARGGENTWQTLYDRLLEPNGADLALLLGHTARKEGISLYGRAKYIWEVHDFSDWSDALDSMGGDGGWRAIARNNTRSDEMVFGGAAGLHGNGVIVPYLKWVLMGKIREYGLTSLYDRFVVTRTDQFYTCDVDLAIYPAQFVWVPDAQDYGGICDRWIVAPKALVKATLDIIEPVVLAPKKYWDFKGNPEALVKLRYEENGVWDQIRRFGRRMFTAATPGDHTRWKRIVGCVFHPYNVCLKYKEEFDDAMKGCGIVSVPKVEQRCRGDCRCEDPGGCHHRTTVDERDLQRLKTVNGPKSYLNA